MTKVLILFAGLLISSFASAQVSRLQQMNQLFTEMNLRFVNGNYVSNKNQIEDFNLKQDAMVADLKKTGGLKKILFIQNDYRPQLNVTLYAFIDEQGSFLSVYWDKSEYFDEEERSYLRFANDIMLTRGLNFVPIGGGAHALMVKGFHFTAASGGVLQFSFLKDYRDQTWGWVNLPLLNKNNSWNIYTEQSLLITTAMVKSWTGFLNGGVKEFILK